MLLSYLKLSFRLLARNPFFTFIDLAGLSVGFAVFFILWPYAQSELNSDQFIRSYNRIERVVADYHWTDNGGESWGHLNIPYLPNTASVELKKDPSIEDATRFVHQGGLSFGNWSPGLESEMIVVHEKNGQVMFRGRAENSICADKNFFAFFDWPMRYGSQTAALKDANSLALSKKVSEILFGNQNPLGEQLNFNNQVFVVSGVFELLPSNSHLQFDYIFSNESKLSIWDSPSDGWSHQYYKMAEQGEPLLTILTRNKEKLVGSYLQRNPHVRTDFISQPLEEIAFSQGYAWDFVKGKSKFMLKILAGVSVIVLIMAWLNFINLMISRAKNRFKEMAARKVSGAGMTQVITQFICHSLVINFIAILIGMTFVQLAKAPFELFLNIRVIPLRDIDWQTCIFFTAFFALGTFVTAIYPARFAMHHTTRQLLSKTLSSRQRITTSALTTTQYVAALALVAWIFIINEQLNFILKKNLGLNVSDVVVIEGPSMDLGESGLRKVTQFSRLLKSKMKQEQLALSSRVSGESPIGLTLRRSGSEIHYGIDTYGGIDENFIPFYGLTLIAGRNFEMNERSKSLIISRYAAERLGFNSPEEAVGSVIEVNNARLPFQVVGVTEDYRVTPFLTQEGSTESVKGRGQCFTYLNSLWTDELPQRISLKLENTTVEDRISEIEKMFNQEFPGNIFSWYFLDEKVAAQYGDQKIARNQLIFFTMLAVVVACLGLLGVVSNKVVEKFKEISVRKILGAGNLHLIKVLMRSTGFQLVIALVIGLPIAFYLAQRYLETFTERIPIQWWHFIIPIVIFMAIMLITIGYVLWKAIRINAVEALKYE